MSMHSGKKSLTNADVTLNSGTLLAKLPLIGLVLGVLGLGLSAMLAAGNKEQFFFSYHVSFMFFLSISLGAFAFVLFQFASRAGWSVVVRRLAENLMGVLPLFALLFIPIIFGAHTMFHWTHQEAVEADAILAGKSPFLNEAAFYLRAALYFILWAFFAYFFRTNSVKQDSVGGEAITRKLQKMSYPGIAVMGLSVSLAAIDWIMSLDPHWYSTIFGVYFFAGSIVAIYAALILYANLARSSGKMSSLIGVEQYHDLGKMLFGFTVFWTYIAFSQFFLIWYANIPEETIWFANRFEGSWKGVSLFLAFGHFVGPFFFMLSRHIKRNRALISFAAAWMLFAHFMDIYWLIMPTFHKAGAQFALLDVTCFVGIGGMFLAVIGMLSKKALLVPVKDPRLAESMAFENL